MVPNIRWMTEVPATKKVCFIALESNVVAYEKALLASIPKNNESQAIARCKSRVKR